MEVNPEKSAASQFEYNKRRSRQIVDLDTPHLRIPNANIPWQFSYKYQEPRSIKIFILKISSSELEKQFSTERGSEPCLAKRKLSRRNKRTIYKMCIRTVLTYTSPVFAQAASKALDRLQVIQNKF
ncbi:hypothetical protein EVAR_87498_1 [Eumeta japonica]|uniref:Uncharacterized protein n=1 Tax=Eumeta variegata TaxID=151549 RepID=A0A4C1VXN2_EUMVA|nr:hypothetical protein EVAR_87498_1 [Eumeta japonica]